MKVIVRKNGGDGVSTECMLPPKRLADRAHPVIHLRLIEPHFVRLKGRPPIGGSAPNNLADGDGLLSDGLEGAT